MKVYYLIKVWARPSKNNPSPAGEAFYYYGKAETLLAAKGSHEMTAYLDCADRYTLKDIRNYGYARLCDARRVANKRSKRVDQFWDYKVTVITEPVPD